MIETEPDLPEGYSWQFVDAEGQDITSVPIYAVEDATTANIWCENGELVLSLSCANNQSHWTVETGLPRHEWVESLDAAVTVLRDLGALEVA